MLNKVADVDEYANPQSNFNTKGIALNLDHPTTRFILEQRNAFVQVLLTLYERNVPIYHEDNPRIATRSDMGYFFLDYGDGN